MEDEPARYVGLWNVEGTTEESEQFRHSEATQVWLGVCVLVVAIAWLLTHTL